MTPTVTINLAEALTEAQPGSDQRALCGVSWDELDEFRNYCEVANSIAFPISSTEVLNKFLARRKQEDKSAVLLDFENRLHEQIENN